MIKSRKTDASWQQLVVSFLAATLVITLITSSFYNRAYGDEYTASGHKVGSIPEKAASAGEGTASILADNMIVGNIIGIEATFDVARIQEYNPVTHAKVSEFSVPCPSGSCNGRGLAFDGTNLWYSILTGDGETGESVFDLFAGDGLIHKISPAGGADISTIPDSYGAGGRGIGAIDVLPNGNLLVSSYLPINGTSGLPDDDCFSDDTDCVIEIRKINTAGTTSARCDIPFDNSGGTGLGNESLVVDPSGTTFLADGGEADLTFLDRYSIPATNIAGTPCTLITSFSPTPVGIGGIDYDLDLPANLVVSSTFATGIGNIDGSPFDTMVGGTFPTDANLEDITIRPPPPGTIIIIKDTIPNGGQNFEFRHDIESTPDVASPFFLDDDSNGMLPNMKTFSNVPADTYEAREIKDADFPLRDIRCRPDSTFTANGGSFVRNLDNAKVTITINGGTVTCTFINGVIPPPCVGGTVSAIQPEDPISMTTVVSKQDTNVIAKTVHAEKQIFDCFTSQNNVPVIADVTIIAEIYENMNTKMTISKQVEVITCVKRINTAVEIDCSVMIPSTDAEIVRFCRESPIEEPQEMNTVAKASINGGTNGKGVVKTIEAQKEVFLCDLDNADRDNNPLTEPEKKVDLITFTETWEDLSLLPGNPILPRPPIETLRCVIKIDTVTVEACQFSEFKL